MKATRNTAQKIPMMEILEPRLLRSAGPELAALDAPADLSTVHLPDGMPPAVTSDVHLRAPDGLHRVAHNIEAGKGYCDWDTTDMAPGSYRIIARVRTPHGPQYVASRGVRVQVVEAENQTSGPAAVSAPMQAPRADDRSPVEPFKLRWQVEIPSDVHLEAPLQVGVDGTAPGVESQAFHAGPAAQLGYSANLSSEGPSLTDRLAETNVLTDATETDWVSVL